MLSVQRLHALAALLLLYVGVASAHSAPPRPLARIAHPTTHAIDILPRTRPVKRHHHHARQATPLELPELLHSDSFRLTLSAFDEIFHLHLRPNDDLIHPTARINYHTASDDGSTTTRTVPLMRETVRAYWGEVIAPHLTADRLRQDAVRVMRPTGSELGWARIIVHDHGDSERGRPPIFEGAFSANGVVHHISTKENYLRNKHEYDPPLLIDQSDPDSALVMWRESDQLPEINSEPGNFGGGRTCAHDKLDYNVNPLLNPTLRASPGRSWLNPLADLLLTKRDGDFSGGMDTNFIDTIGQNAGCPTDQRIVYMGVAADCEYVQLYGSQENATQQILNDWNTASALYKSTFNVSLGIIELQVQDPVCPSTINDSAPWNVACNTTGVDLNDRLSLFSAWRGERANDGAGLWHLVSACPSGSEIGIAWLGTLCQQDATTSGSSSVSGVGVSTTGRTEWQVVAHEIGHNFGAIHDCTSGCNSTSACCPLSTTTCDANAQYIMSPVAEASEQTFSPCTLGNICSLMQSQSMNTSCLVPPSQDIRTISLNQCGNGIVEEGEDCDPGSGTNSTCCDSSTCKFTSGSVCDFTSSSCCTDQCQLASSGTVCRAARDDQCDTAETCTGSSATCPEDTFTPNGRSCGSNGLKCADGQCTSLDLQCQTNGAAMGLTTACGSKDDTSCRVSCQNPNSTGCVVLDTQLIDGSPCGYGGTCQSGNCQSGSALDTFSALYRENLQYSIPTTIITAVLVTILVVFLARCCCCKGSRKRDLATPTVAGFAFNRNNPSGHRRLGSNSSLLGRHSQLAGDAASIDRRSPAPNYSSVVPAFPSSVQTRANALPHERRLEYKLRLEFGIWSKLELSSAFDCTAE
ncbi:unnamed protein product [Peniophora sp. CBMAI 1063]|nr:unnamed protein product [Peniophora sp. CBMAI 1063]